MVEGSTLTGCTSLCTRTDPWTQFKNKKSWLFVSTRVPNDKTLKSNLQLPNRDAAAVLLLFTRSSSAGRSRWLLGREWGQRRSMPGCRSARTLLPFHWCETEPCRWRLQSLCTGLQRERRSVKIHTNRTWFQDVKTRDTLTPNKKLCFICFLCCCVCHY